MNTQMCPGPQVQAEVTDQGTGSETGSGSNNCSEAINQGEVRECPRGTDGDPLKPGSAIGTELAEWPGWREDQMQSGG